MIKWIENKNHKQFIQILFRLFWQIFLYLEIRTYFFAFEQILQAQVQLEVALLMKSQPEHSFQAFRILVDFYLFELDNELLHIFQDRFFVDAKVLVVEELVVQGQYLSIKQHPIIKSAVQEQQKIPFVDLTRFFKISIFVKSEPSAKTSIKASEVSIRLSNEFKSS